MDPPSGDNAMLDPSTCDVKIVVVNSFDELVEPRNQVVTASPPLSNLRVLPVLRCLSSNTAAPKIPCLTQMDPPSGDNSMLNPPPCYIQVVGGTSFDEGLVPRQRLSLEELFEKFLLTISPHSDEGIARATVPQLHAWLKERVLSDSQRDKIKGELALRSIGKDKGECAARGSYGTWESSKHTLFQNPSFLTANRHASAPDHVCIEVAPLESKPITYQGGSASGTSTAEGSSSSNHTTREAIASTGKGSPGPDIPQHSSPPTAPEQGHSSACAPAGDGADPGPCTACGEPPKFGKLPLAVLAAGAYGLLSRDRDTFQGPVEKVLLGCMTLGFLSSFAWLLVRGNPRRATASVYLQWTAVWAVFAAFITVMILLITQ